MECDSYKFHVERGYGTSYHSVVRHLCWRFAVKVIFLLCIQSESKQAKAAYAAKSGREKRNLERQNAKSLSKEDYQKNVELNNRKMVSIFCFRRP